MASVKGHEKAMGDGGAKNRRDGFSHSLHSTTYRAQNTISFGSDSEHCVPASIRDVDGASLTFGPAEGLDPMVALLWSSPSAATEHRSVGGALELGGGADRGPVDRWQTWTRERVKRPVRPGRPGRGEGEGLDRAETDCGCDIRIP